MRLVFAGTPEFALPALEALRAAGHEILAILTQPDRPAGRGRRLAPSPVARRAQALGLEVHKFLKLDADAQALLRALAPEVMVVVAYGLILPPAVLELPVHGCLNIHASLLPRWRGAAPIARAIEAGDRETGVTIIRMDPGLDTGPMLLARRLPIEDTDTTATLSEHLARLGARLIVKALAELARGELKPTPQPESGASYAKKLSKEEARLDWTQPAEVLARKVRAFNPAPVAWSELSGERIRFWLAHARGTTAAAPPGTVIGAGGEGLQIACGTGVLHVTQLQRPGGRVLPAADLVRGWNVLGRRFE
jgi:methionyl-tRNA formyltransferase